MAGKDDLLPGLSAADEFCELGFRIRNGYAHGDLS
jgi:hypothetical protein